MIHKVVIVSEIAKSAIAKIKKISALFGKKYGYTPIYGQK